MYFAMQCNANEARGKFVDSSRYAKKTLSKDFSWCFYVLSWEMQVVEEVEKNVG